MSRARVTYQEHVMKLFSGALVAAVLAAALATGCSESPRRYSEIRPALHVSPVQTMQVGESRRVTITTHNLVGARAINWSVSPNAGRIQVEQNANGQTALFMADQPGTYIITASADLGNGQMVSDQTTVTVHGRPMTTDRINEPIAPAPAPVVPR
jgi:hypothetical protein